MRYMPFSRVLYIGCHKLFDDYRWIFEEDFPDYSPSEAAAETQGLWLEHEGEV